jgi:hypothetical protein
MEFCWVCLTVFPWEIAEFYSINANNLQARKFQLVMLETVCVQLCVCGMLRLRPILGLTWPNHSAMTSTNARGWTLSKIWKRIWY